MRAGRKENAMRAAGRARLCLMLPALVLFLSASAIRADDSNTKEARIRAITTWDADCSGNRLRHMGDMLRAWYNEITDDAWRPWGHGGAAWSRSGSQINGQIVDSDFVGNRAWGRDHLVTDNVDALFIGLHGGDNSTDSRWYGKVRVDEAGEGNCFAYQGHIELGDLDLEFLHISSCRSMDREDWTAWGSSFDGLHQINGFHGNGWSGSSLVRKYRRFADDAFDVSISESWLDNMFYNRISGSHDQCPVSRAVGTSTADRRDRMSRERYNRVLSDPPGLGSLRAHGVRYISRCDPSGKGALP